MRHFFSRASDPFDPGQPGMEAASWRRFWVFDSWKGMKTQRIPCLATQPQVLCLNYYGFPPLNFPGNYFFGFCVCDSTIIFLYYYYSPFLFQFPHSFLVFSVFFSTLHDICFILFLSFNLFFLSFFWFHFHFFFFFHCIDAKLHWMIFLLLDVINLQHLY